MKYLILVFLFFVLLSPFIKAQDTIMLNNGQKIMAKHIHIKEKIFYIHSGERYKRHDSVNKSDVNYIIHESGWKIPMIPPPWYEPITISPAIGLSTMTYLFRSFLGDTGSTIKSWTPVYSLNIDYVRSPQYSIGIGFSWQSVKLNPYVSDNGSTPNASFNPFFPTVNVHPSPTPSNSPLGGPDNSIVETLTRFNVGLRWLNYIRNDDEEAFYIGARVGISFWTDQSTPSGYNSITNLIAPSIQVIIGDRREISKYFGINLEAGIGTPYLANLGIYYKINTVKK